MLERYGSDAVRWRAAKARPGLDSPFDEREMKVGRRLALKVLNASKFVLGHRRDRGPTRRSPSRWTVRCSPVCAAVIAEATAAFEAFDYSGALEVTEQFFWQFCDDYLELVKERAYGSQGDRRRSLGPGHARAGSRRDAPAAGADHAVRHGGGLVVVAGGLDPPGRLADCGRGERSTGIRQLLGDVSAALVQIRGAKSQAKASMRTEVTAASFSGPAESLARLQAVEDDLRAVGRMTGELRLDRGRGADHGPGRAGAQRLTVRAQVS